LLRTIKLATAAQGKKESSHHLVLSIPLTNPTRPFIPRSAPKITKQAENHAFGNALGKSKTESL
jgi:hypothetical protein